MIYTLIAYKENSVDTCRGCVMDTFNSDFAAWSGSDADLLAERWATLHARNEAMERGESGYSFLLFIDGIPAPYCDVEEGDRDPDARSAFWERQDALSPEFERIQELTNAKCAERRRQQEEAAAAAKKEADRKAELARVAAEQAALAAERAEFARLSAKFRGQP